MSGGALSLVKLLASSALVLALLAAPAAAQPPELWLTPPVDGPVFVPFDPPARRWSRGHRGIDFSVPAGTAVRAAADGRVVFVGAVAGMLAVTIDHGRFDTTYSALADVDVAEGEVVARGRWIGTAGAAHPGGAPGLHLGVKDGDDYVDPAAFLGPLDTSGAIYLVPVVDRLEGVPEVLRPYPSNVAYDASCDANVDVTAASAPPNDNVVVVIDGLGSSSNGPRDSALHGHAVRLLGYPPGRVYAFSYAGTAGERFHRPYEATDTFGDLGRAAERLRDLLRRVAARHPGVDVDLLAHSQGGLVARTFLQRLARSWSPTLPRVDHLVTLATPHLGAPAADVPRRLEGSLPGRLVNDALGFAARATGWFPDPGAQAVAQLSPSSRFQQLAAREDVSFGTRVLSLAVPDDFVVPAHRARFAHGENLTLPPAGGFAHSTIVSSERAASVAYDFLRDAATACPGEWDSWGPRLGRLIEFVEDRLP